MTFDPKDDDSDEPIHFMTELADIAEIPPRFKDVLEATLWATKELTAELAKRNEAEASQALAKIFTGKAPSSPDDFARISHELGLYRRKFWSKLKVQEQRDLNGVRGAYRRGMKNAQSPLDEGYTLERINLALALADQDLRANPAHDDIAELKRKLEVLRDEVKSCWPASQDAEHQAAWLAFHAVMQLDDRLPELADALADIPEGIESSRSHLDSAADSDDGDDGGLPN